MASCVSTSLYQCVPNQARSKLGRVQLGNSSPLLSQSQLASCQYQSPVSVKQMMFPHTPWLIHVRELLTSALWKGLVKASCCYSATKSLPQGHNSKTASSHILVKLYSSAQDVLIMGNGAGGGRDFYLAIKQICFHCVSAWLMNWVDQALIPWGGLRHRICGEREQRTMWLHKNFLLHCLQVFHDSLKHSAL